MKKRHVRLRNGMLATLMPVEKTAPVGPFSVQGHDADGWPHLWTPGGHWREDGAPHPFDIVREQPAQPEPLQAA